MLRFGNRGWEVSSLQQQLARAGFNPGPVDGVFGPRTQAAVRAFQQSKGIQVDGVVGPETMGAMGISGFDRRREPRPSAADGFQAPAPQQPTRSVQPQDNFQSAGGSRLQTFLQRALAQQGKEYVFGAEVSMNDPNPRRFDCSELIEWAAHQAGVRVPDGSANQIAATRPMSVEQALRTPGALLYRPGHIAISLGDGRTIEAKGRAYGVGIFNANGRGWTRAGVIPGLA